MEEKLSCLEFENGMRNIVKILLHGNLGQLNKMIWGMIKEMLIINKIPIRLYIISEKFSRYNFAGYQLKLLP